jgi:RNA polymerase-binding protein DksA
VAKKVTKKKVNTVKTLNVRVPVKKTNAKASNGTNKTKKAVKKSSKSSSISKKNTSSNTKKSPKNAVVKKQAKKDTSRPVINTKTYLTKSELEHFRTLLLIKLKEITANVDHIQNEALHTSRQDATGDLSSMPIHMADIGTDIFEQEFSLGLMDTERKIVQEIIMALRRIDEGTYGICEGTGEPIPKMRLEAYPWARYCVRYAEMIEKGQIVEVRNNTYSGGGSAFPQPDVEDEEDDEGEEDDDFEEEDDLEGDVYDYEEEEEEDDDEPFYN